MRRALFLDRDGVLNELVYYADSDEWEAPRTVGDIRIVPGVREALRHAHDAGWLLCIVTNQPSYAKGKTTREDLAATHDAIVRELGVPIARSGICFHHPEAIVEEMRVVCDCRKPGTRFVKETAEEFGVDLPESWMIGDQDSDLACGRAAGCRAALVETAQSAHKRGRIEPDLRVRDLADFVSRVVNSEP